ncbi:hypothetical protein [Methylomonas sp. UP202]|uniref:hypothetical protein n=1 Tax=Methylomonas sp. UP202 TaxID=3040943 RepID=UPI00247962AE|nr:hypothetical protein [Methylomonas sp. UP202]WGS87433.1 hypothetical protein QC632_06675 [Methylomonas sp. UP202]
MPLEKILLVLSAMALSVLGWYIYTPPYHSPREYPPLAETDRQRMDLQLLNELAVNGSRPPLYTVERRRQLILDMAKQGFEVADLAYQLLNIGPTVNSGRHWLMPWERSAYHHLCRLADAGDPSAQCLAALVIARWDLDMRNYERYVVQAANAGQPYCTNILSGLLTIHIDLGSVQAPYWQTIPKNDSKGRELKLLAAKMGVERARLYLMNGYADGWQDYPLDIGKAKCWLALAKQVDTGEASIETDLSVPPIPG